MTPKYIIQDELGISGQFIRITQGESKTLKIYPQNSDGSPLVYTGTVAEIQVKIFAGVSLPSIKKTFTGSQVTKLLSTAPSGILGYEFSLSAADTAGIVANSSGIPVMITITDTTGTPLITEMNFLEALVIEEAVVLT